MAMLWCYTLSMRIATICFPVKDGLISLAPKKKKIGAGFLNGYGGKVEGGESVLATACREFEEESGVTVRPEDIELVGIVHFYQEDEYAFECHIFFAREWQGALRETDEMGVPEAFPLNAVPYDRMLTGDVLWLTPIIEGQKINATVIYKEGMGEVKNFEWKPL